MSDFVNTITLNNGTTYDVQDKRLTVTAADAGKVVSVDSNGNLTLSEPSGGTKLYKHTITFQASDYRNLGTSLLYPVSPYSTIVIINTSSTPITNTSAKTIQSSDVIKLIEGRDGGTIGYMEIYSTGSVQITSGIKGSDNQPASAAFTGITDFTDTVTEL